MLLCVLGHAAKRCRPTKGPRSKRMSLDEFLFQLERVLLVGLVISMPPPWLPVVVLLTHSLNQERLSTIHKGLDDGNDVLFSQWRERLECAVFNLNLALLKKLVKLRRSLA